MSRVSSRASLAGRVCVRRLWRADGLAAESAAAGLRMRDPPPAGIGDRGNGLSSDKWFVAADLMDRDKRGGSCPSGWCRSCG